MLKEQRRSALTAEGCWQEDVNGLWWRGGGKTDGPYKLKAASSSPPLSPASPSSPSLSDPTSDAFERIPFTVDEILPLARELAIDCNVAALSTVAQLSPDEPPFPRSRSVSTRHYISEDFCECSIATKIYTRKVEELKHNPNFSLMWKYESDVKKTTGGWILAIGTAQVVPHPNVGKGLDVDGHDKATIVFSIQRLEIQDYPNQILAYGYDKWRCSILERLGDKWVKVR
mmetsp:Transcript_64066/g.88032  ORF Transcript_64066/g.88032 Transcript_64066/m.88032 type:complete len:229 (-) Transcript_64066:212-898(-)